MKRTEVISAALNVSVTGSAVRSVGWLVVWVALAFSCASEAPARETDGEATQQDLEDTIEGIVEYLERDDLSAASTLFVPGATIEVSSASGSEVSRKQLSIQSLHSGQAVGLLTGLRCETVSVQKLRLFRRCVDRNDRDSMISEIPPRRVDQRWTFVRADSGVAVSELSLMRLDLRAD